jgi:integrase
MDTKSRRINLTQKQKAKNGKWQFYPVQWDGTKPDPRLIIIDEEAASWKGGGAFFLDWRQGGKRKRKLVGKAPREALDAWRKATGVANGSIPDDRTGTTDGTANKTGISIQEGIKQYLEAVEATKGAGTHSSYETCLRWAEQHITKHFVYRLDRNDLLRLFAAGRKEGWRHTFASHMIGVLGPKGLQLAMGHKDIATTSKHLHFLGGDGIKEKVEASTLAKMIR